MTKNWNGSHVMEEFAKIASKSNLLSADFNPENKDFVGNALQEVPTGDDWTRHEKTKDYGVTKEEGKDIIEKAHPKDVRPAKAMGDGALVENEVQQQEKDIQIAVKMPNANLLGVHANLIQNLVKIANRLEEVGRPQDAKLVDEYIKQIVSESSDLKKKVNNELLYKEAFWPLAITIITGLGVLIGGQQVGDWFISKRDGLVEDTKDLVDSLNDMIEKGSPSATRALQLLNPFVSDLTNINFSTTEEQAKFVKLFQDFNPVLVQLIGLIAAIEAEVGEERWYHKLLGPLYDLTQLKSRFSDFQKSYEFIKTQLSQAKNVGSMTQQKQEGQGAEVVEDQKSAISHLQNILFTRGFLNHVWTGKVTGELDQDTIQSTSILEQWLTDALRRKGEKASFSGQIIQNGKVVMDLNKLEELMTLLEQEK